MSTMTFDRGRLRSLFGDGRDGSVTYSVANSRWETDAGVALSNGSLFSGVGTTTLIVLRTAWFTNVTVPASCTLQLGDTGANGLVEMYVSGTLTVAATGVVTAGTVGVVAPAIGGLTPDGGAAKSTTGVGSSAGVLLNLMRHGTPGAGGGGGGDGTNAGGSRSVIAGVGTQAAIATMMCVAGSSVSAGTTGAGAAGSAPPATSGIVSSWESPWMKWPSPCGIGGSGGALKQSGGSNVGGAGGAGGAGKLPLRISARLFVTASGAIIQNDGGNGTAGSAGVATNAAGDISGGGGGGGGGAGGPVSVRYGTWTDSGATVRSTGGSGAAGGLGYQFNASARPTSDGGAGGAGSNGIVVTEKAS